MNVRIPFVRVSNFNFVDSDEYVIDFVILLIFLVSFSYFVLFCSLNFGVLDMSCFLFFSFLFNFPFEF